jgi:hypothetical protein
LGIEPLRRLDIVQVISIAEFPHSIPAAPCHFSWSGMVCTRSAVLCASPTAIDGHNPALHQLVQCRSDENRKAQRALVELAAFSVLASFTHDFGFLLALAAFLTCYLLTNRRRKAMVILAGSGVVISFVPWMVYHSQMIDAERTTWIGKLSVLASLRWFEYLSFGGPASLVRFSGVVAVVLVTGGWRQIVARNSITQTCALLCLRTLTAAATISFHTPILTSRNMIVVLLALYLIAAELARCLVRRWGKLAGATYVAAQVGLMSNGASPRRSF